MIYESFRARAAFQSSYVSSGEKGREKKSLLSLHFYLFYLVFPFLPDPSLWLQQVLLFQLLVLAERNRHHAQDDAQQAIERPLPRSRLMNIQNRKNKANRRQQMVTDGLDTVREETFRK